MQNKTHQRSNDHRWIYYLMGLLFIVVAVVLAILFSLNGKTTISDQGETVETMQSISCANKNVSYPFVGVNSSDNQSIKLDIILNNNKINTASLTYQLLTDSNSVEQTRTNISIAINKFFAKDSLEHNALNATFSSLPDSVQMTLYAKAKDITGITAKYFLLESANGKYDNDTVIKALEEKGLLCKVGN